MSFTTAAHPGVLVCVCIICRPPTEHKAYFAVLAVLFQPTACKGATPESLEARRNILKRLKRELHIPESVSDAVHG